MKKRWPGFLLFALLLLAWEMASAFKLVDPVSIPRVSVILASWIDSLRNGQLLNALLPSLGRIFAGFALATLVAVPLGLLMGSISLFYRLLEPITEFIRPIPAAAYIPVAILFLGIGNEMKVFVVFLACLFPILLNTYGGVRAVDPVLIDTGRTFGVSKLDALRQIIFPAALPSILTGMRISLGISLIVAVVAEMIAGNSGHRLFHPRHAAHLPRARHVRRHPDARAARLLHQLRLPQDRAAFPALARNQRGDVSGGDRERASCDLACGRRCLIPSGRSRAWTRRLRDCRRRVGRAPTCRSSSRSTCCDGPKRSASRLR
jgi:ABC-type nitrate/sulfonate/bicarbonate transport system permease component